MVRASLAAASAACTCPAASRAVARFCRTAGARREADGALLSSGGRVLNVCARGETLAEARERAYAAVAAIDFPGGFHRTDIGWRAL